MKHSKQNNLDCNTIFLRIGQARSKMSVRLHSRTGTAGTLALAPKAIQGENSNVDRRAGH
jgi:hypothetical protein